MMAVQPFFKVVALTFTFGTVCYMVENVWKPNELKLLPNSREAEVKREDVFPPREQRYLQRDGQLTSANASKLLQYYISKVVQKNFKIELKNIEAFTKEIVNTIFLNQTRLKRNVTEIVAENNGTKPNWTTKPKLLCWILADPDLLDTKVKYQKQTWAKRCDKLLVMSSTKNDTFPAIGLNVTAGRNHIASKVRAAWKYIYSYHIKEYDFFIKTDPDTYLVMENLLDFLKDKDPHKPHFYGHRYKPTNWNFTYMAGGPGLLLTRETVRRLVTQAFVKYPQCMNDGQGEDYKVCKCLDIVGCVAQDTRDSLGRETFLVLDVSSHIYGLYPDWYRDRDTDGSLKGDMCCSDYPISFHYVNKRNMYVLEYWLYHAKVHGKETVSVPWPKILGLR